MAQRVKNPPAMQEMQGDGVWSLDWEDPLEEEVAPHSSVLAWKIPWTEEPGGWQSTGSQTVGRHWAEAQHIIAPLWMLAFLRPCLQAASPHPLQLFPWSSSPSPHGFRCHKPPPEWYTHVRLFPGPYVMYSIGTANTSLSRSLSLVIFPNSQVSGTSCLSQKSTKSTFLSLSWCTRSLGLSVFTSDLSLTCAFLSMPGSYHLYLVQEIPSTHTTFLLSHVHARHH